MTNTKSVSVSLTAAELTKVDELKDSYGASRSWVIRILLSHALQAGDIKLPVRKLVANAPA